MFNKVIGRVKVNAFWRAELSTLQWTRHNSSIKSVLLVSYLLLYILILLINYLVAMSVIPFRVYCRLRPSKDKWCGRDWTCDKIKKNDEASNDAKRNFLLLLKVCD